MFKKILPFLVVVVLGSAAYYWFSIPQPETLNTPPLTTTEKNPSKETKPTSQPTSPITTTTNESAKDSTSLTLLAQQQCGQLQEEALIKQCVGLAITDIESGKTEPEIPAFDPEVCNGITDTNELHKCRGKMSHDFAVSSGNIKKCGVIPWPDIKLSCQQAIIINEIKKLYGVELALESEEL